MTESFRPTLLLSMPQLQDPNFARTVVLLCEYVPEGAFGLVLNRPTDMPASQMVRLEPPVTAGNEMPLHIGGPVEPERGWILSADEPEGADYRTIQPGLYLSTSPALLRKVLESSGSPRVRILAGYAGWGPGQLDAELAQSAWLMAEVEFDLIFDVDPSAMWETAIRRLGADPSALQTSHGVH
jgi:putative transcriptional regulator